MFASGRENKCPQSITPFRDLAPRAGKRININLRIRQAKNNSLRSNARCLSFPSSRNSLGPAKHFSNGRGESWTVFNHSSLHHPGRQSNATQSRDSNIASPQAELGYFNAPVSDVNTDRSRK